MAYKLGMFSWNKRFAIAAGVSLCLLAGCKTPPPSRPLASATPPPAPVFSIEPPGNTQHPAPPRSGADNMAPQILAWDTLSRECQLEPGMTAAHFTFNLTNISTEPITLYDASASCDCTIAQLPTKPWTIPPGGRGRIQATIDLLVKRWSPINYIVVFTSKGNRMLTVQAVFPPRYSIVPPGETNGITAPR